MDIQKIWERTLVTSSQFILRKAKIELDVDSFRVLVEDVIEEYNKCRPYSCEFDLYVGAVTYKFTPENDKSDLGLKRVPDWISECVPIRTFLNGIASIGMNYNQSSTSELIIATQYPFVYKKGVLTVALVGNHKITAVYKHIIVEVTDPSTGKTTYDIPTITLADIWFFKLLKARFMQGIGRSRRSFSLSDIPITTDAEALVADGEALEEKTIEDMHLNKNLALVYG